MDLDDKNPFYRESDTRHTTTLVTRVTRSIRIVFEVAPGAASFMLFQMVLAAAADPFALFCMQRLIDSITRLSQSSEMTDVITWITLLAIATLLTDNINFIKSLQIINIQRQLNTNLTEKILSKFRRVQYSCFENPSTNDTIERVGSEPQQKFLRLFQGGIDVLSCLITTIGLGAIVMQTSIWLVVTLIAVVLAMLFFEYKGVELEVSLESSQTQAEREMDYFDSLMSEKRSLFELRIFDAVSYIRDLWQSRAESVVEQRMKTSFYAQRYRTLSSLCFVTWMTLVMITSLVSLMHNQLTLGSFVALVGTIKSLTNIYYVMETAFSNIARNHLEMFHYDCFTHLPEAISSPSVDPARTQSLKEQSEIEFDQVSFNYPGSKELILNDISFTIQPGELTALVGRNGAGKSTIVKLLARLYEPTKGQIRIGGIPLSDLSQKEFESAMSFMFQDFTRYSLTLRESVGMGCIEKLYDDDAIIAALTRGLFSEYSDIAHLDVALGKFEEDGIDLSGGQWQRLALARALLADALFMVLDEPTSSLDPIAEDELYRSFASAMKGHGCLVISHRMATAKMCHNVLVIDQGRIIEQGAHEDLMQSDSFYRQLYKAQSKWYSQDLSDGDDPHAE